MTSLRTQVFTALDSALASDYVNVTVLPPEVVAADLREYDADVAANPASDLQVTYVVEDWQRLHPSSLTPHPPPGTSSPCPSPSR